MTDNIVIIGGGIAGLSLAYHLHQINIPYQLYEKEERVGGINRSEMIAGCIFDYAPRLFLLKDQYATDLTVELLGENVHFLPFGDWSYHRKYNVYTRLPFQRHMYGIPLHAIVRNLVGFLGTKLPNGKEPKSYQDWLYQNLGKPVADMIIAQESKKWKHDPVTMDYRWAPARVPIPEFKEMLRGALSNTKHERNFGYTITGGIEALMKAFASRLHESRIHAGAMLTSVDTHERRVTFKNGETASYQKLVSTMPLPILIERLTGVPEDIRETATKLKYISLKIAAIVVDRDDVSDKNFIYVYDPEYIFHRVSIMSNLSDEMAPPGRSALVVEITYIDEPPMEDSALLQRVIHDLIDMQLLRKDDVILGMEMLHLPIAYPMPTPDRIDNVEKIRQYLESDDIYLLGRFGEWEYVNMHDIIPRARDLSVRLEQVYELPA